MEVQKTTIADDKTALKQALQYTFTILQDIYAISRLNPMHAGINTLAGSALAQLQPELVKMNAKTVDNSRS